MVGQIRLERETGIRAIGIYADLADVRPALFAAEKRFLRFAIDRFDRKGHESSGRRVAGGIKDWFSCLAPVASERAPPSPSLRPSSLDVEDYVDARNSEPPAPGLAI
jgi:hypothetical protein